MTRKCFLVESPDLEGDRVTLSGPTAHHVANVLRLREGDAVELRDGRGSGRHGSIVAVEEGKVSVSLLDWKEAENESPVSVTLAMAYAQSEKMDLVLRQATELGVRRFAVFRARRSQYGLTAQQAAKRIERWTRIAREALCQCGRLVLPEIDVVQEVPHLVEAVKRWEGVDGGLRILASEGEAKRGLVDLWETVPSCAHATAVIGPEGGWAPEEEAVFIAGGFHAVRLGPRILRLETAASALVASVQLLWGDLS